MKTILSFLFVAVFAMNSFAQNSNLTIFSEDGLPFYLILNGIRQNEQPETNVRVDGLMSDYYTTKIIFADNAIPTIERKMLMVIDADRNRGEVTYKIKADKKGEQVLRYFSFTPAAQVLPPPPNVVVHTYNAVPMPAIVFNTQVTETTTTTTSSGGTSDNVNVGISLGGINIGASVYVDDHAGHNHTDVSHQTTTTTTTTTNYNNNNNVVVVAEEPACMPMERNLFQSALTSIKGQTFSDTQLSQAKEITASNCLNAMQIKEICKIFSFEDTKLEYAKFAYQYCYDRNNYWQINDSFSFKSSVSELNDYIRGL